MPVLTILFFGLGGLVLGPRAPTPRPAPEPAPASVSDRDQAAARRRFAGVGVDPFRRGLLGIGCCLLAVAPVYIWLSQPRPGRGHQRVLRSQLPGRDPRRDRLDQHPGHPPAGLRGDRLLRRGPTTAPARTDRDPQSRLPRSRQLAHALRTGRRPGRRRPEPPKAARRAIRLYPQSSFVRQQAQQLLHAPTGRLVNHRRTTRPRDQLAVDGRPCLTVRRCSSR